MRFLKSHCTGYKYFEDSLIVHMDISCFDLTVAFQTRIISIIRRWRNPGFTQCQNF